MYKDSRKGIVKDQSSNSLVLCVRPNVKSSHIIFKSQENPKNAKNFWFETLYINVNDID